MKRSYILVVFLIGYLAQVVAQTYDTVYLRPPHAALNTWYDSCPDFYDTAYQFCSVIVNGNRGNYKHVVTNCDAGGTIWVNGLGCMVSADWMANCRSTSYTTTDTTPSDKGYYLYLYELQGDTLYQELKRVRWDTATPQVLKLPRRSDTANVGFEYCYYYEAMFDTFVPVESLFAIGGNFYHGMPGHTVASGCRPEFYVMMSLWTYGIQNCNQVDLPGVRKGYLCESEDVNSIFGRLRLPAGWGPFFALTNNVEMRVTVDSSQAGMGIVRGSGHYVTNTVHTIQAYPSEGYGFAHWNDGDTANPRYVTVQQDTSFTAFFYPLEPYEVTVLTVPTAGGTVNGGGVRFEGEVTLTAVPTEGYVFEHWDDGTTEAVRAFLLHSDTTVTAYFRKLDSFMVTVELVPPQGGELEYGGSGMYCETDWLRLLVKANEGWTFRCWDDGSANPSRVMMATSDTVLRAYFHNPEGIAEPEAADSSFTALFVVRPNPAKDYVTLTCQSGTQRGEAVLRDALGKELRRVNVEQGTARIPLSDIPAGVYLVTLTTDQGTSTQRLVVE